VKKLVCISVLALVLACLVAISPAAGETYNLTLIAPQSDSPDVAGLLFYDPNHNGMADDWLAAMISGYVGSGITIPSGDYDFATWWFFGTDASPTPYSAPLAAGTGYQLTWNWQDIKFGFAGTINTYSTFNYSKIFGALAEEQTVTGDHPGTYMVAADTNGDNTYSIAGIFKADENLNIFAFMSAEVPAEVDLSALMPYIEEGATPGVLATDHYGSTASGALDANPVPLPGSLLLLGSGLLGLGACGWRKVLDIR